MQEAELQRLAKAREQELSYKQQMDGLEVDKQKRLAQIESERFGQLVQSLGSDTLKEMARAGPDTQVTAPRLPVPWVVTPAANQTPLPVAGEDASGSGAEVDSHHRRFVPHQPLHHRQRPAGGAPGPVRAEPGACELQLPECNAFSAFVHFVLS